MYQKRSGWVLTGIPPLSGTPEVWFVAAFENYTGLRRRAQAGKRRPGTLRPLRVLDGVYVEDGHGGLRFHELPAPLDEEMDEVLLTIERRIVRLLVTRGLVREDEDAGDDGWGAEAPVLAGIAAAAVQGRRALGERPGAVVVRVDASGHELVTAEAGLGPCHARGGGYDVHAAVMVPAHDRARLERLCRYTLRPPVAHDRVQLTPEGRIALELRHRWSDGTTHLVFEPLELLERLAALTPRPRVNLLFYYGVLGARSAWRARLVPAGPSCSSSSGPRHSGVRVGAEARRNYLWAELMHRTFEIDVLACPRCGGRLAVVALIEDLLPPSIRR